MNEKDKIEQLQKQIDELAASMRIQQQSLMQLQRELFELQGIEPKNVSPKQRGSQKNIMLESFIGVKLIHFIGIIVLVIGLSIGVKYAIDRELISEQMRIALVYVAGVLLYAFSWLVRKKYQFFSAILFSGAMASLYFTTYASFVYYSFFGFGLTFFLMALFTVYTSLEAIRYNRQEIAILGMVGAYGIPFLISRNADRVDFFFSYIFLINCGVVFLSFFQKKWKLMIHMAMFVTWFLFIGWGLIRYEEKDFFPGLLFLIVFSILFTLGALRNRLMRAESLSVAEIQQVLTNNIATYISSLIVFSYGIITKNLAATTGWYALLLLCFAGLNYLFFPAEDILLQSLTLQSVVLIAMFISFQWHGLIVTMLWVTFAILLFAWGIFAKRSWSRLAALLLMVVTLGKLIIFDSSKFTTGQKIITYIVIGTLLLIFSFYYQKFKQKLFDNRS